MQVALHMLQLSNFRDKPYVHPGQILKEIPGQLEPMLLCKALTPYISLCPSWCEENVHNYVA